MGLPFRCSLAAVARVAIGPPAFGILLWTDIADLYLRSFLFWFRLVFHFTSPPFGMGIQISPAFPWAVSYPGKTFSEKHFTGGVYFS
jgi:hypothetical protein